MKSESYRLLVLCCLVIAARAMASAPANYVVSHYDVRGHFDWSARRLAATVDIRLKLVDRTSKVIFLDSRVAAVRSVSRSTGGALPYEVDESRGVLAVDLSSIADETLESGLTITVAYEAKPQERGSRGLFVVPARKGDPIAVPVVYTHSEPESAAAWLPCLDVPSNRATFSIELRMKESETMISNGELVKNEVTGGIRRMRYQTHYTIPTYLFAFAQGEFTTETRDHHGVPISIWARRGLRVDWEGTLDHLISDMNTYERLLLPYPFEKYVLVMLPGYDGGMEHAGVTFQPEELAGDSDSYASLLMLAHELSHQWFGDLMTIRSWDDLWIKEGMATLLEAEASRPFEDRDGSGTLFGGLFTFSKDDAIVDFALAPSRKFTTGPYARAGWAITQVRARVGETVFWQTLRDVLRAHRFGSISTREFLEIWKPSLGDDGVARLRKAIHAKGKPELRAVVDEKRRVVVLDLLDPNGTMIAPFEVRSYDGAGSATSVIVSPGKSQTLAVPEDGMLVLDAKEYHPTALFMEKATLDKIAPLLVPRTDKLREVFLGLGTQFQWMALVQGRGWKLTAPQFGDLMEALPSERARFQLLRLGCELGAGAPSPEPWKSVVRAAVLAPPYIGVTNTGSALTACNPLLPKDFFAERLSRLATDPADPSITESEIAYLAAFSSDPPLDLMVWGSVGVGGPSVTTRVIGVALLSKHLQGTPGYARPAAAELPQWKRYIRDVLGGSEAEDVLFPAMTAVGATKDKEALPMLRDIVMRTGVRYDSPLTAVCTAFEVTRDDPPSWRAFVSTLGDLSKLPDDVGLRVSSPERECAKSRLNGAAAFSHVEGAAGGRAW